jgi:hypothetical protein
LQIPEAQALPAEHDCPLALRQAPLTACVPVGHRQVLVVASHVDPDGDWHEQDVEPASGADEPATHFVHGGPPPGP